MECPTCHRPNVGFRLRSVGAAARFGGAKVPVRHKRWLRVPDVRQLPGEPGKLLMEDGHAWWETERWCEPEPKHAAPAYAPAAPNVTLVYLGDDLRVIASAVIRSGVATKIPGGTTHVRVERSPNPGPSAD